MSIQNIFHDSIVRLLWDVVGYAAAMLNAAHLEAHEVIGYWAPKEWMLPTAMPLVRDLGS